MECKQTGMQEVGTIDVSRVATMRAEASSVSVAAAHAPVEDGAKYFAVVLNASLLQWQTPPESEAQATVQADNAQGPPPLPLVTVANVDDSAACSMGPKEMSLPVAGAVSGAGQKTQVKLGERDHTSELVLKKDVAGNKKERPISGAQMPTDDNGPTDVSLAPCLPIPLEGVAGRLEVEDVASDEVAGGERVGKPLVRAAKVGPNAGRPTLQMTAQEIEPTKDAGAGTAGGESTGKVLPELPEKVEASSGKSNVNVIPCTTVHRTDFEGSGSTIVAMAGQVIQSPVQSFSHHAVAQDSAGVAVRSQIEANSVEGAQTEAPQVISVSPSRLEVGVTNGSHGWLKVRAELNDGVVTAHLSSATPVGEAMLHREVGALQTFLREEQIPLRSISVTPGREGLIQSSTDSGGSGREAEGEARKYAGSVERMGGHGDPPDDSWVWDQDGGSFTLSGLNPGAGNWLSVRA